RPIVMPAHIRGSSLSSRASRSALVSFGPRFLARHLRQALIKSSGDMAAARSIRCGGAAAWAREIEIRRDRGNPSPLALFLVDCLLRLILRAISDSGTLAG